MAGKSNIEWTGHTWNPLAGCSVLTPGCKRCYAMKMAARLEAMGQPLYAGLTEPSKAGPIWTGVMRQAPEHVLLAPLKRKKPTTYFVNSMSDLFHENVPDDWIDRVFAVMALAPQHTFQVLTKRAARMRDYCSSEASARVRDWCYRPERHFSPGKDPTANISIGWPERWKGWPLPNVWLGVSTERQQEADERIPLLLQTPAAIRFISAEPLLGPIDLVKCPGINWLPGGDYDDGGERAYEPPSVDWDKTLDWVIVGGESGHGYRPMAAEWVYGLRDQCIAAGVPVFIKQMAGKKPIPADLLVRQMPRIAA